MPFHEFRRVRLARRQEKQEEATLKYVGGLFESLPQASDCKARREAQIGEQWASGFQHCSELAPCEGDDPVARAIVFMMQLLQQCICKINAF